MRRVTSNIPQVNMPLSNSLSSNGPTETEFRLDQAEKLAKTNKKRNDGTEGLDAVDERSNEDRYKDGWDLLGANDRY